MRCSASGDTLPDGDTSNPAQTAVFPQTPSDLHAASRTCSALGASCRSSLATVAALSHTACWSDPTAIAITAHRMCSLRLLQLRRCNDEVILFLPCSNLGLSVCKDRFDLMQLLEALALRRELQVVIIHLEGPAWQICLEPPVLDDVLDCESVVRICNQDLAQQVLQQAQDVYGPS